MKKKVIILFTTLSLLCLVACGEENNENYTNNVGTGNHIEDVMGNVTNELTENPIAEATKEPTAEFTKEPGSEIGETTAESPQQPTPTEEPVAEETPEPTQEPAEPADVPSVVYEGIDMNSDLPGMLWIETFVGIIDEPKIVVYSNETGRKEIVEYEQAVIINPDTDVIALYLPDGYEQLPGQAGLYSDTAVANEEHSIVFLLNPEETRENGTQLAALFVEHDGEEIWLVFTIIPE